MESMRSLLYDLPPELRNEVYGYLSTTEPSSVPKTTGLPLQLKRFDCKHTTVQICPVHFASTGLLAFQKYNFLEAREYGSWILGDALELRVGVVFKSRVNTFVQADWNKKLDVHLNKLAKQHPWLRKVAKYNIQILWDTTDSVLKSKKNKRTAGQIPREMVRTITSLMDEDVRRKRSHVRVRLHVEHRIALEHAVSFKPFGLKDFLLLHEDGYKSCSAAILKRPFIAPAQSLVRLPLKELPPIVKEDKDLLVSKNNSVQWTAWTDSHLVLAQFTDTTSTCGEDGAVEFANGVVADYVMTAMASETLM
ncbi:hypothetical protein ACN47E_000184 [Coniothyrium glycines]